MNIHEQAQIPRDVPMTFRDELLTQAHRAVMMERNQDYGDPLTDFTRAAKMFSVYLHDVIVERNSRGYSGFEIMPHDVAVFQILVKISRLAESDAKMDTWVDIAGYAACGYDVAMREERR